MILVSHLISHLIGIRPFSIKCATTSPEIQFAGTLGCTSSVTLSPKFQMHSTGWVPVCSPVPCKVGSHVRVVGLLWFCLCGDSLLAHDPGLSTAQIRLEAASIGVDLTFAPADIESMDMADSTADPNHVRATAGVGDKSARLSSWVGHQTSILLNSDPASLMGISTTVDANRNVHFRMRFRAKPASALLYACNLFDRLPPGHRQFVTVQDEWASTLGQRLLSAPNNTVTVAIPVISPASRQGPQHSLGAFLGLCVQHILTGYDHLLFLFSFLIVCARAPSALKIITAFTLAHSITLALATLNFVHVPSRLVEPLIAVSIVYVAIQNLYRNARQTERWLVTFAFGLVHGLGFASVLRDLGVGATAREVAIPLLSFNLGVELGQLAVAGLLLPMIWMVKSRNTLVVPLIRVASTLAAVAGTCWFVERITF